MVDDQAQSKQERKDFFISYTSADRRWAEWIAWQLEEAGYHTLIQAWDIRPGSNFVAEMDEAAKHAECTIPVLSEAYLASNFTFAEWAAAFRRDPKGKQGKALPVRIERCAVEGLLGPIGFIDLVDLDEQRACEKLLAGIKRGRAKPATVPFPTSTSPSGPLVDHPVFPGSLPPVWNVPYPHNPFFTGREELLSRLHNQLQVGQVSALSQPQAISGLGGIGKTQLALEYAYRYRGDYQAILWAQADTRENLTSSYLTIAALLNLPEKGEQESTLVITAVKNWLQRHTGWLLILDSADDLTLARDFLPPGVSGQVLLTTRTQATGRFARRLEVSVLPTELGTLFLLRRAGLLPADAILEQADAAEQARAKEICEELGGLPLALDQAGAYIEETGCSLSEYQHLYLRRRADLLAEHRGLIDYYPHPVATIWSLSFAQVEQKNPAAADLLRLCAFLAPDAIPEEIITQGAEYLGPQLAPVGADSYLLNQSIETLRTYSLLRRETSSETTPLLSVHRLVQAVLKDQMDEHDRFQWAERAIRAVNAAFPEVEYQTWPQCDRLLPHALRCADLIVQEQMAFPEGARLLNQTGLYLNERARYAEAEPLLKRALEIYEQQLGANHPDTASSLNNLADLYRSQGKYAEAEPLLKRALEIYEQQLGANHPDTATSLNNLADLYRSQGKYARAKPLLERALAIREQQLGAMHPGTALSLNNLANLYMSQGKYAEAEPLLERALAIREQQLGTIHPDTATSLNNLANLYMSQGKYAEAEPLLERALAIREQQLGTQHPDTAQSLNNLAGLHRAQGKYEQAELLYVRALSIREQQLGPEHPDTVQSLNNLAELYRMQGKYEQAEPLYQRVLYILVQILGPDHPDVVHSRDNLTSLHAKQSLKLEAQRFLEDAGFSCIDLDGPIGFLCIPKIPLWQKKIQHTVYVHILTNKRLNGDDVLRIHDTTQGISKDITLSFAVVDKPVEDHAWLQIAALRANNFSVIPIPSTLLIDNRIMNKAINAITLLGKHVERFLGQGADPYDIRHPIFDVLNFFGREALARDLIEQMNSGQPIGLFGLRKMGKSSLMRYMQGLMPCPTGCLDLQAGAEPISIYERLLRAWNNDAMVRFKIDLGLSDANLGTEDPATEFVKITRTTLDRLMNKNPEARLAIFLDEIELIMPSLNAAETILEHYLSLMHMLRGLVQEDGRISFMVAGVDSTINRVSRWGDEQKQNPFFMLLEELYIPPLFELDCIQMIRNIGTQVQLSYSEEAVTYIAQMSGGHPYLARQLCSLAYRQRHQQPGEVTQSAIQQAVERFLFDPKYASSINTSGLWGEATNVKLWGEQAAKANQHVLFILAQSIDPVAESVIINGPDPVALRSALFSLHELSVIHPIEDSLDSGEPYYVISFGLFHSWIRRIRLGLEG